MRKISVLLMAFALICSCAVMVQGAEDVLTFKLNDDGLGYYVADCKTSATGKLTVPATYNDLPVTAIGPSAFSGCIRLTDIVLHNGITAIGTNAFYNCPNLTYTVDGVVKYLGSEDNPHMVAIGYASSGMSHLQLHNNTKIIYDYAFEKNYSVTSVTLNEGLVTIGNGAFYDATVLTSITIPNSVTTMGEAVFQGCYRIASAIIGDGVKSIGGKTFFACSALKDIAIGDSVSRIDAYAFENCTGLQTVLYKGSQSAWDEILIVDGNDALLNANVLVDFKGADSEYTVVFKNWDGEVLSTQTYKYGQVVTPPTVPAREGNEEFTYTFAGWNNAVTNCVGDATYTAVFTEVPVEPPTEPTTEPTEPSMPIIEPTQPTTPATQPTNAPTEPTAPGSEEEPGFPTGIIVAVYVVAVAITVVAVGLKKKKA